MVATFYVLARNAILITRVLCKIFVIFGEDHICGVLLQIDRSISHLAVLVLDSLVDIDGEGVVVAGHDVDHLLAVQAGRHGDMVPHAWVGLLGPDQGGHAVAGNITLYIA